MSIELSLSNVSNSLHGALCIGEAGQLLFVHTYLKPEELVRLMLVDKACNSLVGREIEPFFARDLQTLRHPEGSFDNVFNYLQEHGGLQELASTFVFKNVLIAAKSEQLRTGLEFWLSLLGHLWDSSLKTPSSVTRSFLRIFPDQPLESALSDAIIYKNTVAVQALFDAEARGSQKISEATINRILQIIVRQNNKPSLQEVLNSKPQFALAALSFAVTTKKADMVNAILEHPVLKEIDRPLLIETLVSNIKESSFWKSSTLNYFSAEPDSAVLDFFSAVTDSLDWNEIIFKALDGNPLSFSLIFGTRSFGKFIANCTDESRKTILGKIFRNTSSGDIINGILELPTAQLSWISSADLGQALINHATGSDYIIHMILKAKCVDQISRDVLNQAARKAYSAQKLVNARAILNRCSGSQLTSIFREALSDNWGFAWVVFKRILSRNKSKIVLGAIPLIAALAALYFRPHLITRQLKS